VLEVDDSLHRHVEVPLAVLMQLDVAVAGRRQLDHGSHGFIPLLAMQGEHATWTNGGPDGRSTATTIVTFSDSFQQ
jgi:hypothetical protein